MQKCTQRYQILAIKLLVICSDLRQVALYCYVKLIGPSDQTPYQDNFKKKGFCESLEPKRARYYRAYGKKYQNSPFKIRVGVG